MAAQPAAREPDATPASLTRRGARSEAACLVCASSRVTRIGIELADGSQVDFTHCLECEHRSWVLGDEVLSLEHVLRRSRGSR